MITTPTRPVSTGAIPGVDPGITGGLAFLFPTGSFLFPTGALEVGDIPVVAGDQVEALGWTARDLFGLDKPAEKPHPSYSRLSRYDETGLIWLLQGRPVVALTEATAAIQSSTGAITIYRRHNKPALGPVGDSLDDLEPPGGAIGARSALAAMTDNQTS
jgi:hypothetical protein